MIGHGIPSPETARRFLYQYHKQDKIEEAQQRRSGDEIAYIPEESEALAGLGRVNRELVEELGRRCPEQRIATVDQDATIIESRKQEALRTYEGERGYQPMLALWAEMNVVLADEFRDGNVPTMMNPLAVAKKAFAAPPDTVTTYYYRGDSACHESDLIHWLRDENREGAARADRICDQRSHERGVAGGDWKGAGGGVGALWGSPSGGAPGMRGGELCAWGEVRAQGHAAAALYRDPDSAAAGESVRQRQPGEAFRGDDEHPGMESGAVDRVAPGEGGEHRSST
jgi:hypothetical protein